MNLLLSLVHVIIIMQHGTLDSKIDVWQEINVGPGKFGKKNKRRALNNRRAWKIWQKFEVFIMKKTKKNSFSDFRY